MSVSGNSEVQLYSDEFAMHLHKPAAQRDDHGLCSAILHNPRITEYDCQPFSLRLCLSQKFWPLAATKNVTSTLCGAPIRDRTAVVSVAGLAGGALAIVFFLLRMVTRLPRFGVSFGLDDAVLTFVIVGFWLLVAACLKMQRYWFDFRDLQLYWHTSHMFVSWYPPSRWRPKKILIPFWVASHGLGKDMWTVPFDNITHILYVSIPLCPNSNCTVGLNLL